jgi:hypothetical protein
MVDSQDCFAGAADAAKAKRRAKTLVAGMGADGTRAVDP